MPQQSSAIHGKKPEGDAPGIREAVTRQEA